MIPVYHSLHDPLTDAYTLGVIIELNFYKPYYFCYYIFLKKFYKVERSINLEGSAAKPLPLLQERRFMFLLKYLRLN